MQVIDNKDIYIGAGFIPSLPYEQLVELIKIMENSGYDQIWCGNEKLYRDMWVTMGLVSAITTQLDVATFIAEPYSYHPALIAAAIATVNEATNGRAILLLGTGGFGFTELGIKRNKPLATLEESIGLIRRLLEGETISMKGNTIFTDNVRLLFKSESNIPIYVASRGKLIQRMAGRIADGVMLATHATPRGLAASLNSVFEGCKQAGRDPKTLKITVRVDVCIDQNRNLARATVKPMIAGMILTSYPDKTFIEQAGLSLPHQLASILDSSTFQEVYSAANDLVPNEFVDAFSWAGTPDDIAQSVASVINSGFSNLCIVPHAPPGGSILKTVKDFMQEVMPRVRKLIENRRY